MKYYTKIALIIGLCLMCLGTIMASFDIGKILAPFYRENDNYQEMEVSMEAHEVNSIKINTDNEKVTLIGTDSDVITIKYYESEYINYKIDKDSGSFTLTQKSRPMFFNLSLNFWHKDGIIIEAPRNLLIKYYIYTSNGKIEVQNIETYDVFLRTTNGSINVYDCDVDRLTTRTSNGSITLDHVISNSISNKTSNGRITLDNVTSEELYADTSNGKIIFSDLHADIIEMDTSNGRVEGSIIGNERDYYRDIKTSNGNININGAKHGTRVIDNTRKEKTIKVKTSNGGIDIDFNRD